MANPFAQYARNPVAAPPEDELQPTTAAPAPAAAPENDNPFSGYGSPQVQAKYAQAAPDTWWTTVRGKRIQFEAPKGADKATVRAAAQAAGVSDASNRSLQFGKPPTGPTPEQQRDAMGPVTGAITRGVDFVLPVVDEAAAAATAAGMNPWRRPDPNKSFGDDYTSTLRDSEDVANATDALHPTATRVGRVGAFLGSLPLAAEAKFLQGTSKLGTALRFGSFGSAYGGANAYANNSVDDRWNGVPLSAAIGGGIGLVTPAAAGFVGTLANRLNQRLGITDFMRRTFTTATPEQSAERAAVDVISTRAPQKPSDMRARVQEFRDTGHEPTLTNAMDESGRGLVSAMARRPGPGRQIAQDAYDARRLSMPERIDRNMAAAVEADAGGNPDVVAALKKPVDQTVAGLTEKRSADMEAAMTPIRGKTVPVNARTFEILNTADGQRAMSQAMRTVTDKPTLDAMRGLQAAVRSAGRSIDPRMPPAVQQQIMDQLANHSGMTVDIADRLARKFNAMADTAPADAQRALRSFGRELRDHARQTVPEYDQALQKYAGVSKSIEAVDTGGDFIKPNQADDFAGRAAKLSDVNPTETVPRATLPGSSFEYKTEKGVMGNGDTHHFTYTSPNGEVVNGRIGIDPKNPGDAAIHVNHKPGDLWQPTDANRVGPTVVKDIGTHIAQNFPELNTVGGMRVTGARRVANSADVAEADLSKLRGTTVTLPSDRQLAQQGARRAVQQAAGENISAAPGVARKIAVSPEQSIRNNALFSPLTAEHLEKSMAVSARDLTDFAHIAPNTGSATALRTGDDEAANAMLGAIGHAKTGNFVGAALKALQTVGVRDQDAQKIVEMAVDPARTDELVAMLEKSYNKRTAQKIGRVLGLPAIQQTSRGVGGSR